METKIVSSLEKCFYDQKPMDFQKIQRLRMYKNERASIQFLAYDCREDQASVFYKLKFEGELAPFVNVRLVEYVTNMVPSYVPSSKLMAGDSHFLRDAKPGLYPDILMPLKRNGCFPVVSYSLHPLWIDFETDGKLPEGKYSVKIKMYSEDEKELVAENEIEVEILPAELPKQETIVTNWFYADCLADYYNVEVFSDEHFEICERFIKTAVKNGTNMIFTPVLTPPLDTAVGGERTTTQLVKIKVVDGKYQFDFSLLLRWIEMLKRCKAEYIEISHLFTQWGAYHAPKVMAEINGEYKKIFGWETDASGKEYVSFIRQFLKELTSFLEKNWDKQKVYFHISDEPSEEHLKQYEINKSNIYDILDGWKIIDALSHVEFFKKGVCKIPVPLTSTIEDFMKEDINERWVYYCCGPEENYSNRLLCMTLPRTRSIGIQMYAYGIKGFLHWGYNFYNNQFSYDCVNPFLDMTAGYWGFGGDALIVYPGRCGIPLESMRMLALKQAVDDIKIMKLCEKYYGKERVINQVESILDEKITFKTCVEDSYIMQKIRDRMDDMILDKINS